MVCGQLPAIVGASSIITGIVMYSRIVMHGPAKAILIIMFVKNNYFTVTAGYIDL